MVKWFTDPGLLTLDGQLRDRYPGIIIYHIGDANHKPPSDHLPEADGSVDASDFMVRGKFDREAARWLVRTLVKYKDPRIAYIIFEGHIISSTVSPWMWRDYGGSNPHDDHIHLSVNDKHESDRSEWKLSEEMRDNSLSLSGFTLPVLKYGESDSDFGGYDLVRRAQRQLGVSADGEYGSQTASAVKALMDGEGDGKKIDIAVWRRLYGLTVSK